VSNEPTTTVAGHLSADPEIRVTPIGRAVALFTVASATRLFDSNSGEWRDGNTLFLRCSAWRRLAENIADSGLRKGTRVVVAGRLQQRAYETDDGQRRSVIELVADEVGVSLRHTGVQVVPSRVRAEADRPVTTPAEPDEGLSRDGDPGTWHERRLG